MHYYQHNIGDYARDTGHLTVLEHGIYRLLLDWCYLNEKPITTEQAMRVGRGNPVETQSVISEFFSPSCDGWMHKRVVQEVADYHKKADKNRQNGAKGGRPKPNNNPVGSQTDAKHNPNQEPLTNNQEPIKKTVSAIAPPDGVSDNVWQDFKKLRNAKKAPLTQTALAGIEREALKAGLLLSDVLGMCCERGWTGFKASWLVDKSQQASETTYQRSMREKYQTIAPSIAASNPNAKRIDPNAFFDLLPAKKLEITHD
jgi:uncharacterized protein YdaU (DUF1376 family)